MPKYNAEQIVILLRQIEVSNRLLASRTDFCYLHTDSVWNPLAAARPCGLVEK